ncbi:MAG: sensor histidine kinase [Acidothermaceae bacterium]
MKRSVTAFARAAVRAPFTARSRVEVGYLLAGVPLAGLGFACLVALGISGPLSLTFFGLPMMAMLLTFIGVLAGWHRTLARRLLKTHIDVPTLRTGQGLFGWLQATLRDPARWRMVVYVVWQLPFAVVAIYSAGLVWVFGIGAFTYPLWRLLNPLVHDSHGHSHRGVEIWDHIYLDTWWRVLLTCLIGAIIILAAPWYVHGLACADRGLMRRLLGPTKRSRVRQLEESRAFAVDDAAQTLRRIERDLHDGAQARLVAVAMAVGQARDELDDAAAGALDVEKARVLLEAAAARTTEAIADLRDIARGILPPALDAGLEPALATLAAGSRVPVAISVDVSVRPPAALEAIAYFCVAELLTNVAKHAAATAAVVDVAGQNGALLIQVSDNGQGDADPLRGSGLTGLVERVRTVDGRLDLSSPAGGPTVIRIELPYRT